MDYKRRCVTAQFAVETRNGIVTRIGKSFIITPKSQFRGGGVKWFDDKKLIRGGDGV